MTGDRLEEHEQVVNFAILDIGLLQVLNLFHVDKVHHFVEIPFSEVLGNTS